MSVNRHIVTQSPPRVKGYYKIIFTIIKWVNEANSETEYPASIVETYRSTSLLSRLSNIPLIINQAQSLSPSL
ncbi:MAG: hypothetical protein LBU65_04385 [Planctomycetaceae bacterium]|nr:hypothetical protein [Planctomycetaceae bacterium]